MLTHLIRTLILPLPFCFRCHGAEMFNGPPQQISRKLSHRKQCLQEVIVVKRMLHQCRPVYSITAQTIHRGDSSQKFPNTFIRSLANRSQLVCSYRCDSRLRNILFNPNFLIKYRRKLYFKCMSTQCEFYGPLSFQKLFQISLFTSFFLSFISKTPEL